MRLNLYCYQFEKVPEKLPENSTSKGFLNIQPATLRGIIIFFSLLSHAHPIYHRYPFFITIRTKLNPYMIWSRHMLKLYIKVRFKQKIRHIQWLPLLLLFYKHCNSNENWEWYSMYHFCAWPCHSPRHRRLTLAFTAGGKSYVNQFGTCQRHP